MLLLNLIPPLHAAGTLACLFLPLSWPLKILSAFAFLYILPLIPARILRESLRKSPPEFPLGSADWGVIFSGGFGLLKKVNFKLVRMNTCVESGSDEHKKGTHDRGLRSRAGTT